jgi:protein ImuB
MKLRILSLWLPSLSIDRLLGRARRDANGAAPPLLTAHRPLVTFESRSGALRLAAVCPNARDAGLAPGMMLADARAMLPALQVRAAEPEADRRLLDEIAAWCERYTPHVAIDRSHGHEPGGALWLDVTGCAHLFGGEAALLADLLERLGRQGLHAEAAIADHPGAAWAVARYGAPERRIVPPGGAMAAVAPLPVAALRLEPAVAHMLERLGLSRVEQLHPLPRPALAARFGDQLLTRLDQALGRVDEPISPREPRPGHRAALNLAEPVGHLEGLDALTRRLVRELCAGLETASAGARRLVLTFMRVDNSTASIEVGTSRACREPKRLFRLVAEKLEKIDPGFGIERAILDAVAVEPLLPEPIAWRAMGAGDLDQARDLAPLVDRLSNRLRCQAVVQLAAQESHIPERAQRPVPALSRHIFESPPALNGAAPGAFSRRPGYGSAPSRPLRLLLRPEPIEAMAPLPDAPPLLFRWRRVLHRVARVTGPERLAPEWWRAPDVDPDLATRDYFAVEDTEGGRFWLFREGLYLAGAPRLPRWYLHGLFA